MTIHLEWKNTPDMLRAALRACGQSGGNVKVEVAERFDAACAFTGNRAVACAVELSTGQLDTAFGAWGGAVPPGVTAPPLDRMQGGSMAIPPGFAVVAGETGGRGTFVTVYLRPENVAPLLAAKAIPSLTDVELAVLLVHARLNSGGRKDWLRRCGVDAATLLSAKAALAVRKLISVNKAGASAITTDGRNALEQTPAEHIREIGRKYHTYC